MSSIYREDTEESIQQLDGDEKSGFLFPFPIPTPPRPGWGQGIQIRPQPAIFDQNHTKE
jgi:hypothetical protein